MLRLKIAKRAFCDYHCCPDFQAVQVKHGADWRELCVQEAMEQRMVEVASQAEEPHNSDDERYARLQELRQKLAVSSVSKQTSEHSV